MFPTLLMALVMALTTRFNNVVPGGLDLPAARAREEIWSLGLLLLLPLCALHFAQGLRAREHSWMLSFPGGLSRERAASGLGALLIACVTLFGIGLLAEYSAPSTQGLRHTRSVDLGPPRRIPAGQELALLIDPGQRSHDARISLEVVASGGAGPTTEVRLELIGQTNAQTTQRIDGRDRVELSIPKGSGAQQVVLVCMGPGDAMIMGGRCLTLLEGVQSMRQASVEIGARAAAIIALILLVVALVRPFLKPGLTTLLALGLVLLGIPARFLPMGELLTALHLAAEGRLTRTPQLHEFCGLILLVTWLTAAALAQHPRRSP